MGSTSGITSQRISLSGILIEDHDLLYLQQVDGMLIILHSQDGKVAWHYPCISVVNAGRTVGAINHARAVGVVNPAHTLSNAASTGVDAVS